MGKRHFNNVAWLDKADLKNHPIYLCCVEKDEHTATFKPCEKIMIVEYIRVRVA